LLIGSAGMAASRVGLWSFDLIQVKQLQETLADHPRRNTLSVEDSNSSIPYLTRPQNCTPILNGKRRRLIQVSSVLNALGDLFLISNPRYILAMALSQPTQFPWAAIASFTSVFCGAATYTIYLRQRRGHVFHAPCLKS